MKRTQVKIHEKYFDILYDKRATEEGYLFQGKISLQENTLSFSYLKHNGHVISFTPEIDKFNSELIILAIDHNEIDNREI